MNNSTYTLEFPPDVFEAINSLASELKVDPTQAIAGLVKTEMARLARMRIWESLVADVQRTGHPLMGKTTEEIVEHMRKTRQEIRDAEYAHLYR